MSEKLGQYSPNEETNEVINLILTEGISPVAVVSNLNSVFSNQPRIKDNHRKLDSDTKEATLKSKFTGKNPSYLTANGEPRLITHSEFQNQSPTAKNLKTWFVNPETGVGAIGGWDRERKFYIVLLDFDSKHFSSREECKAKIFDLLDAYPILKNTLIDETQSGGFRIAVKLRKKPDFTLFCLNPGGKHVGEALGQGKFAVLAPSKGVNGNYTSLKRARFVVVDSLESIGIFKFSAQQSNLLEPNSLPLDNPSIISEANQPQALVDTSNTNRVSSVNNVPKYQLRSTPKPQPKQKRTGSPKPIAYTDFISEDSRRILGGYDINNDRSSSLKTFISDVWGCENFGDLNNLALEGDPIKLIYEASFNLGIEKDDPGRTQRIMQTCMDKRSGFKPAVEFAGGLVECWKKIKYLDYNSYVAFCPEEIKAKIAKTHGNKLLPNSSKSNGNSSNNNKQVDYEQVDNEQAEKNNMASIGIQAREILSQNLSPSEQKAKFIELATEYKIQVKEIESLAEVIETDSDAEFEKSEAKLKFSELLHTHNRKLNLEDYLWGDGGKLALALTTTASAMPTTPAFFFTTLLPACASRIGISSRIIIKPSAKYTQPCILWTAIVARSGKLKTPAQNVIIQPLIKLEAEEKKLFDQNQEEYKKAEKSANKEGSSPPELPKSRHRYMTKDATVESLERIHCSNPRGLLYYSDELAGMFKSRNVYRNGKGADEEKELDQWNGSAIFADRKDREIFIEKSAISRTGSIQYEVLQKLAGDHEDSNGHLARWLFCAVKAPHRYIAFDDTPDTGITELLENLYRNLGKLPDQDYLINKDAQRIFQEWQHKLVDAELQEKHPGLQLVYPKIEAYTARFALWLHCVNAILAGDVPDKGISGNTMMKAVELAAFYLEQAKFVYAVNSPQSGLTGSLLKLQQYAEGKEDGVTPRQIKANLNSFKKTPTTEIRRQCDLLVTEGYFREIDGKYLAVARMAREVSGVGSVGELLVPTPTATTTEILDQQPIVGDVGDVGGPEQQEKKPVVFLTNPITTEIPCIDSNTTSTDSSTPPIDTTNITNNTYESVTETEEEPVGGSSPTLIECHQHTNNNSQFVASQPKAYKQIIYKGEKCLVVRPGCLLKVEGEPDMWMREKHGCDEMVSEDFCPEAYE